MLVLFYIAQQSGCHPSVKGTTSNVHAFINALCHQEEHSQCSSRLRLDYKTLVRRLWSTECWDGVVNDLAHSGTDYTVLLSNIIWALEPRAKFQVIIALIQQARARLSEFRA